MFGMNYIIYKRIKFFYVIIINNKQSKAKPNCEVGTESHGSH